MPGASGFTVASVVKDAIRFALGDAADGKAEVGVNRALIVFVRLELLFTTFFRSTAHSAALVDTSRIAPLTCDRISAAISSWIDEEDEDESDEKEGERGSSLLLVTHAHANDRRALGL